MSTAPAKQIEILSDTVARIKAVVNEYFTHDPWTGDRNENYKEWLSAQDTVDRIVAVIDELPIDVEIKPRG